ncbi:MAG TPA: hypothetical protein VKY19_07935 [Ktedonosporobacter sp.]|jgi:hypothetical protein|nr:hypothetical protein [Ktedonosporobacter sp.]
MLDQLQVPTPTRTLFPLTSLPCTLSHDHTASTCSYAVGPLAPEQITRIEVPLPDGEVCPLLVPVAVPRCILDDPACHGASASNYLSEEASAEEEAWTMNVPRLVNHIYMCLTDTRLYRDLLTDAVGPDFLPWQVGWLVRDLTRLAETDHTLAAVGMAHPCFLLPLLTQPRPATWPRSEPYHPRPLHDRAVKAYRARVHCCCEQGNSYEQAQRLALVGHVQ